MTQKISSMRRMRREGARRMLEVRVCKLYLRNDVVAAYVLLQPRDIHKICINESSRTSEGKWPEHLPGLNPEGSLPTYVFYYS